MAEPENEIEDADEAPKKKSKKGLIIGVVLALALGGGGFFAAYSGILGGGAPPEEMAEGGAMHEEEITTLPAVAFVSMDPLVVSLGPTSKSGHLRFHGSLEVTPGFEDQVSAVLPRVIDVLNSYLRAVDTMTLQDPSELIKLRSQMLRRIQLVTGEGQVRDLLILEFVIT